MSMTKRELRMFLDKSYGCMCGLPEKALASTLRLLELCPLYDHQDEMSAWLPDDGVRYLILYWADKSGLLEHGTGIGGAWLTPLGEQVRDALRAEAEDEFAQLLSTGWCIHGYGGDELDDHDCLATVKAGQ